MIPLLSADMALAAADRQTRLTKPAGALGRLESLSVRLAAMTGRVDWLPECRACLVFAADHGVTVQGVSAYPQSVTYQMVLNFLRGGAAINVLARQMGARLTVVDAGVIGRFEESPGLVRGKIAPGTADFSVGPAMKPEELAAAWSLGREVVLREVEQGLDILAVGEMGIGNTTSASAMIAAITGRPVAEVTGRGTGVDDASLRHKREVIERSLILHAPANVDTLRKLGGLEIAAMAGAIHAAAELRVPVLVDGLISTAAAMAAVEADPDVRGYLIASHRSVEPGHRAALEWLGLEPLLDLDLRLGEGTGALLALPLVEAAMRTLQEMATFDEAGVSKRDAG
jgi:nicotinate-nucleotide--dimethylbenzimidazole phosphoribosyltransferase